MTPAALPWDAPDWCEECWDRHSPERRLRLVRRLLPASGEEIRETLAHFYPGLHDGPGARRLNRDLHALGARRDALGLWRAP